MDNPGGIRLIVILAQRETAELVSQGHLRWPPSFGQDWGAMGCYKEDGPAQIQSPFGAPDLLGPVVTPQRVPVSERGAGQQTHQY